MAKTALPVQGAQVLSLVGELNIPYALRYSQKVKKKKKKKKKKNHA